MLVRDGRSKTHAVCILPTASSSPPVLDLNSKNVVLSSKTWYTTGEGSHGGHAEARY